MRITQCRTALPSLVELADLLEDFTDQAFGVAIRALKCCGDFADFHHAIIHLAPEMMPLHKVVLGAIGDTLSGGKKKAP